MSRNRLHLSHLEPFKQFLIDEFRAFRPGRGDFQVLQVQIDGGQWARIYLRLDMPEHYTVDRRIDYLVTAFIKNMKETKEMEK